MEALTIPWSLSTLGTLATTSSNEEATDPESLLLTLPVELRQGIFKYLLHDVEPCNLHLVGLGNIGCWCADGLSRTNRQLYDEIRPQFYKGVKFVFNNPMAGERFFKRFGHKTEWVTSLKVTYTNTIVDSCFLQDIFNHLSNSHLRTLELQAVSSPGDLRPDTDSRPLYLLTSSNTEAFSAIEYDLLWRSPKHSLSRMGSIMSFSIVGHPGVAEEEAIFHLSAKMRERAHRQGKVTEKTEKSIVGRGGVHFDWFYKIEILTERKYWLAL